MHQLGEVKISSGQNHARRPAMNTFFQQYPYWIFGLVLGVASFIYGNSHQEVEVPVMKYEAVVASQPFLAPTSAAASTIEVNIPPLVVTALRKAYHKILPLPRSIDRVNSDRLPKVPAVNWPPPPPLPPPPPPPPATDCRGIFPYGRMPLFPGCNQQLPYEEQSACADLKLLKFIHRHLKYPASAREEGLKSAVVVRFIVEKDGAIGATEIVKGPEILGKAVIAAVLEMNKQNIRWQPGRQGGRPVRVSYHLPVRFCLL